MAYRLFLIMAVGLLYVCMGPACAEGSMADLLMGKVAPLSITIKAMTPEWKKMSLETGESQATATSQIMQQAMREQMGVEQPVEALPPSGFATYYTRGDLFTCRGESYLLAYRTAWPESELFTEQLIQQCLATGEDPGDVQQAMENSLTTADTPLYLCLLNLRNIAKIVDVRPVPTPDELAKAAIAVAQAREKAQWMASKHNLEQLAMAVQMYVQETDETLPVFTAPTDTNMLPVDQLFHPVTHEPYHVNIALSGKALGDIRNPEETPLAYEASAWPNGYRLVAFMDGHVAAETQEQWAALQDKWKLE